MITADTTLAGRYHLESLLGRGGMADVYRGRDLLLDRPVAVKVVRGASEEDARRFAREVRTMAALSHHGIVQLFDAGTEQEVPYLVMELVEGSDLPAELAAGALDPERVSALGRQLARALAHAHAMDVVHRDVKPGNVLLDATGRVCLSDFGIARLADATRVTVPGMTSGTAAYLAPEQLSGEDVGPPADVYALGLVLLEALTGRREYTGTAVEAAMSRLQRDPVVPDDLPEPWTPLLRAMTARAPAQRPSADEVAARLSGDAPARSCATSATIILGHDRGTAAHAETTTSAPSTSAAAPDSRSADGRAAPPVRRERALIAGVGVLLAAAAVLAIVGLGTGEPTVDDSSPPDTETSLPAEVDAALDRLERAVHP